MIKFLGQPAPSPSGLRPHFSLCAAANGFLFTSGQMAFGENGDIIVGDIAAQTHQVLNNLESALRFGGADRTHIVKCMVWLTEKSDFPGFNDAYKDFFDAPPPARSTVASALMVPNALIEIEAIAIEPTEN